MIITAIRLLQKYKTIIKFIISGGTAAFVHIGLFSLFTYAFGINYLISTTLGYLIAYFVSFSLQKFWTFQDRGRDKMSKQMSAYFMVGLVNLGINDLGMFLLISKLGMIKVLAQIAVNAGIAVSSFIIYRYFIFTPGTRKEVEDNYGRNILIATGIYPPDIGGPATYVKTLCEELPKKGYKIKVVTYGSQPHGNELEINDNFEIYRIGRDQARWKRYIKYFFSIWKQLKWSDSVYLMGPVSEGLPAFFACILGDKKYILKVVGDYAWEQGKQRFGVEDLLDEFQDRKYSKKVELMRSIQRIVAQNAEQIITPSEYLKSIVTKWGVNRDKIKVIYNAVNKATIDENRDDLRDRLKLKGFVLITVGRLVPWKGIDTLINLMPELLRINNDYKLLIIGDGPDKGKLIKLRDKLELKESVYMLGSLSQDKLWQYMFASDIFALNTGYEGLPHVVIEAMQIGLPVITTRIGGNPELIEDNKSGWLVEYNNKNELKAAINSARVSGPRVEIVRRAYEKSLVFNKENMVNGLLKIIESHNT